MRWVSTRVLPEPAPATTSNGPPGWTTASAWSGLSPVRRSWAGLTIARPMLPTGCDAPGQEVTVLGGVEDLDAVLAEPLGDVHHGVGRPEEQVGVIGVDLAHGDADARPDIDGLPIDVERPGERRQHPVGDRPHGVVLDGMGDEHRELVAPEASDHVVVA